MRCDPNAWAKDLAVGGEDGGLRIPGRLGSNCGPCQSVLSVRPVGHR